MGKKKDSAPELQKGALGFWQCFMIAVGGAVGMAIFSLSGTTYAMAGPSSILAWILGGMFTFVFALNVAEMATKFPRAGGLYVYPTETLGNNMTVRYFGGWLAAWSWLNVTILGTGFGAIYVANYLGGVIPGADQYTIPIAVVWVVLVYVLNVLGISLMGKINLLLTTILLVILGIYAVTSFMSFNSELYTPFIAGSGGGAGLLAAIPVALLAYNAVIAVAGAAEEIRDARRTIPRVIGFSVAATVVIYVIVLLATYGLIPWQEVHPESWSYYAPLQYAVVTRLGASASWLNPLISLGAVIAITTTMLILTMDGGRTLLAMARSKILPESISRINKKTKTPIVSLTIVAGVAAIIALFPQFTNEIIVTGSFTMGVVVLIMVVSVLCSRKFRTDVKGTFVTPGGSIVQVLALVLLIITLTQLAGEAFVLSFWWYVIGIVIFFIRWAMKGKEITSDSSASQ